MYRNLKIYYKLLLGFSVLILIAVVIGGLGIYFIQSVNNTLNNITDVAAPTVETADDLIANLWEATKVAEEIIADEEIADVQELFKEFNELSVAFNETFKELEELVTDKNFLDDLEIAQKEHAEFLEHASRMHDAHMLELEKEIKVKALMETFEQVADHLGVILGEAAQDNEDDFKLSQDIADYDAVEATMKLDILIGDALETAREFLSLEDPDALPAIRKEFEVITAQSDEFEEQLKRSANSPEERKTAQEIETIVDEFEGSTIDEDELFDEYQEQLEAEFLADELAEKMEEDADAVADAINVIVDAADHVSDSADELAAERVGAARLYISLSVAAAILFGLGIAIYIARMMVSLISLVTHALNKLNIHFGEISEHMNRHLASNDWSKEIRYGLEPELEEKIVPHLERRDELGQQLNGVMELSKAYLGTGEAINKVIVQINQVLGYLRNVTDKISTASDGLASSSQTLSQGASEQAANMEEISASVNELVAQTEENKRSAQQCDDKSIEARTEAEQGNARMKNMVSSMEQIAEQSKQIMKVNKVIDEIAFQTNLLALNAAVEAARAGRHGKGFAVVAEEVRNLAARSAEAAKETSSMIEESVKLIQEGVRIANDTAGSLELITEGVNSVSMSVAEIARSSNEQHASLNQIALGVEQISSITNQNTENAEQTASASTEMQNTADVLDELLSRFKLNEALVHSAKSGQEQAYTLPKGQFKTAKAERRHGSSPNAQAEPQALPGANKVSPDQVVDLDDSEFGRY